jgi:signal transduction histidine kinase
VPAGGSRLLALPGGGRLKAARGEFFDQGHRREFLVLEEVTGELRAGEKATYETLVRMVSHEVNNSVAAVGSLLESCRTYAGQLAVDDRGDYETALAVAVGRLESLRAFIAGFAEVVRLPPPAPAPCDLERLVRDVLHLFAPELARRRIRCRRQTAGGPLPPLALDSHQLEQVLVNVLRNAAEAIGEDGEIVVELGTEPGGRPYLAVRDSGPGFPDAVRERLFTPFFTTKRDGRGLGLTLIREVVAGHGFDLRLDNHPEGGAELKIWLAAARSGQASGHGSGRGSAQRSSLS